MQRRTTYIFLSVIAVLLLQVVLPVFDSMNTNAFDSHNSSDLHSPAHSILAPALLKDKEETEGEVEHITVQLFQIFDFSDHTTLLSRFHKTKLFSSVFHECIVNRPAIFILNSLYLI